MSLDNAADDPAVATILTAHRPESCRLTVLDDLPAALARPDVQSTLADVSWRTGAAHAAGVSVVYGEPEPQLIPVRDTATGGVAEAEVVWQGSIHVSSLRIEEAVDPMG